MTKRAALWINPQARQGQVSAAKISRQISSDFELVFAPSENFQQWLTWLKRHRAELDLVIVGGGDGTLNRVVDDLVDLDLPLGILPLGTANDLARTLGIPRSIEAACRVIAAGYPHRIDLGWVNGKLFFNVASLGLSVHITKQLSRGLKRRWGIFAYAITALRVLYQMQAFSAQICCSNAIIQVRTVQIAVGNGRYYGGGLAIASNARIDDQRLDLYSLEIEHWWQIFFLLPAIKQGNFYTQRHARFISDTQIEIRTSSPQPINTDGELTTRSPASFRVIPQALTVMVPYPKER